MTSWSRRTLATGPGRSSTSDAAQGEDYAVKDDDNANDDDDNYARGERVSVTQRFINTARHRDLDTSGERAF